MLSHHDKLSGRAHVDLDGLYSRSADHVQTFQPFTSPPLTQATIRLLCMARKTRSQLTQDQVQSSKKRGRLIIIISLVLAVLFGIGSLTGSSTKTKTKTLDVNASPSDKLKFAIQKEVGSSIQIPSAYVAGDTVTVILSGTDNLTEGLTKSSNRRLVLKAIDGLRTSGVSYEKVVISVNYPLTDKLGNTREEKVLEFAFTRDRIVQINTDGVDVNNMDNGFADISTYIHPAFRW